MSYKTPNNNNQYQNNNQNYQNNNNQNYQNNGGYNNNYNNQNYNNQGQGNNYNKRYNNLYIYVPAFFVDVDFKFSVTIKNILPKGVGFWISKSRIFKSDFNTMSNVLTLSIDLDKNIMIHTNAKSQKIEIPPNQVIDYYQKLMAYMTDIFKRDEDINKFLLEFYKFNTLNIIEQQRAYNEMIAWKNTIDFYNEKQEYLTNKQEQQNINNTQINTQQQQAPNNNQTILNPLNDIENDLKQAFENKPADVIDFDKIANEQ